MSSALLNAPAARSRNVCVQTELDRLAVLRAHRMLTATEYETACRRLEPKSQAPAHAPLASIPDPWSWASIGRGVAWIVGFAVLAGYAWAALTPARPDVLPVRAVAAPAAATVVRGVSALASTNSAFPPPPPPMPAPAVTAAAPRALTVPASGAALANQVSSPVPLPPPPAMAVASVASPGPPAGGPNSPGPSALPANVAPGGVLGSTSGGRLGRPLGSLPSRETESGFPGANGQQPPPTVPTGGPDGTTGGPPPMNNQAGPERGLPPGMGMGPPPGGDAGPPPSLSTAG